MREKATRSPGRRKMDSQLIFSMKMQRGERIAEGVDTLLVKIPRTTAGAAIVDITANVGPELLQRLRQAGAKILGAYPQAHSVRAEIDLNALDTIAEFPEIYFIQPMQEAITRQGSTSQGPDAAVDPEHLRTTRPEFEERESSLSAEIALMLEEFQANAYNVGIAGVRKSEADLTHRAAAARNTYGSDGTGIKIGVLSDGVRNLAAAQASGDLGPVTVLPGQSGTSPGQCARPLVRRRHGDAGDHPRHRARRAAVLRHRVRRHRQFRQQHPRPPRRRVRHHRRRRRSTSRSRRSRTARRRASFRRPTAASSSQAVNDVTAAGALYFSSAGNSGNKNDGTSGVWEGDFVDGGDAAGRPRRRGTRASVPRRRCTFNVVTAGRQQPVQPELVGSPRRVRQRLRPVRAQCRRHRL